MKKCIVFVVSLFTFYANPAFSADLSISAELLDSYCTEHFGMVNVSFENSSSKWIEIKKIDVSFGSPNIDKKVSLVTGERLISWAEGINKKRQREAYYARLVLGAFAVVGVASSKGKSNLGRGVMLGSVGALTMSEITSRKTQIDLGPLVPQSHLFYGKILVPPDLSASRWAVFNTDENDKIPDITHITINAELSSGDVIAKKIGLRGNDECSWQSMQMEIDDA